jgi:isoleucyl-tRNA synthetase
VVALKTALDDGLREEGLVRELVHAVQLARKNAGLRIEDTIDLALDLPAALAAVLDRHEAYLKSETLASGLTRGVPAEPAPGAHTEVAKVEGLEIGIGLSPTGTIFTTPYG